MTKTKEQIPGCKRCRGKISGTVMWEHEEEVSVPEFLRRLNKLLKSPVLMMMECDGDMLMSEYQKLVHAHYKLSSVVRKMEEETNG